MELDPQRDSRDDCLREVEEALNISIPVSLKNVLKINACDNAAILCDISEKDLQEMEDFSLRLMPEERDTLFEKGPLVRVTIAEGKSTVIKKSSLCWLLEEATQRVSADRLRRFFSRKSNTLEKSTSHGSIKPKTKILPNRKKITKKRLCSSIRRRKANTKSTSNSESSDNDQISVKYDDSTDTESFSDEPSETHNRLECHSSNFLATNMTSSTVETSSNSVQPECGKFYAIYYEQRWYLGLITKIVDNEYVVKFLRQKKKSEKEFLWPKPDDISKVLEEFIFYGPIEVNGKDSEVPLQLSVLQLKDINERYRLMREK